MKIYIVQIKDRHCDTTAKPFCRLVDAIEYAKESATEYNRFPEDLKEHNVDGWLYCIEYSSDGDCCWVTEHELS